MAVSALRVDEPMAVVGTATWPPDGKRASCWPPRLAGRTCLVSSYFLANFTRLPRPEGGRRLNTTEVLVVIELMDLIGAMGGRPTVPALARRMGITERAVRYALKTLKERGFVEVRASPERLGNTYAFSGLIRALEALLDADSPRPAPTTKEAS